MWYQVLNNYYYGGGEILSPVLHGWFRLVQTDYKSHG